MASLEEQFEQALTEITLGDSGKHLLEANAVTECMVSGSSVNITMDLPEDESLRATIKSQVEARLGQIEGITQVTVRMAGESGNSGADGNGGTAPQPPASSEPRAPQRPVRETYLDNYAAVIAVASGKGGVGKSTVAVNLAVTLAAKGYKTSLFDADIYGPSIPIMMGLRDAKPKMAEERLEPLQKYDIDLISIGNLVEEAAATIWRGPIVHQVLEQLLRDTKWPGGDFMVMDLPPGTGDAQLTLSQLVAITGAVIVSTPQDVALLDAIKAVSMFQKVDIPVLGLVENMSGFVCPSCGIETAIFNKGNAMRASGQRNIPFLGSVPIETAIREGGDDGKPIATAKDSPGALAFDAIAETLMAELEGV